MKFALVLLMGLVGLSCQDHYAWPIPYGQAAINKISHFYKPIFYADGLPAGYDIIGDNHQTVRARGNNQVENRFLVTLKTATSTVLSTVTSTMTTATVVKCIPSSQFSATAACARRRRGADETEDSILESPGHREGASSSPVIQADLPKPLEASVIAGVDDVQPQPEIISSQYESVLADYQQQSAQMRAFTSTVTVTSNITSFVFVPTTISSTVSLGIAAGLICLPTGYVVC